MKRYFLELAYHGKNYHGWQKQPNAVSIQETLEKKISLILGEEIHLTTAGRTDAGVHALQTYAHFDLNQTLDKHHFIKRINSFLSWDIVVKNIYEVPANAHARYDARERTYIYQIIPQKNPFLYDYAWLHPDHLDVEAMNRASEILLQYDDFTSFSKVKTDVKHFLCNIMEAQWQVREDRLVFSITANRFLRNMVRAIVGTLVEIGEGKRKAQEMHEIIRAKDRNAAGPSAPAKGLFLKRVVYKPEIQVYLK